MALLTPFFFLLLVGFFDFGSYLADASAVEKGVRAGTMLVIHKATFDEAHSKASPGHVLWEQTLRWAARNPEIHEVELLTFDHMAQRWGGQPMALGRALLCPTGVEPLLRAWWPHHARTTLRALPGARPLRRLGRRLLNRR